MIRKNALFPDDEISSTEKLLALIRKKENSGNDQIVNLTKASKTDKSAIEQKRVTIGIDFRGNTVTFVKIRSFDKDDWELIGYRHVEDVGTENLQSTIKTYLSEYQTENKKNEIWAFISSAKCDVRHISIPKVSQKQIANSVYWTTKKELSYDEENNFFDYRVLGEFKEKDIVRIAVMVYTVPNSEIDEVKKIFSKIGVHVTGLTLPAFSIQNLLKNDLILGAGETIANLYIGHNHSQINIFYKGNLAFTRRIKSSAGGITETVLESVNNKYNISSKDNPLITKERINELLFKSDKETSFNQQEVDLGLSKDFLWQLANPAIERLVRQIERTFQYYGTSYENDNEKISLVYIYGALHDFQYITNYIQSHIEIKAETLNVLTPGIPFVGNCKLPDTVAKRSELTPAVGLALSKDTETPNFLMDYKKREQVKKNDFLNKTIRISLICLSALFICIFLIQLWASYKNKSEIDRLKQILATQGPRVDADLIKKEAARMKNLNEVKKMVAQKYSGIAAISELIERTPTSHVRLLRIKLDLGSINEWRTNSNDTKSLNIEGIILKEKDTQRERELFDTTLAAYIKQLEKSILFKNPSIVEKGFEYNDRYGETLHFNLNLVFVSEGLQ